MTTNHDETFVEHIDQIDGAAGQVRDIADLAQAAAQPTVVTDGLYITGAGKVIDQRMAIQEARPYPTRTQGNRILTDAASFTTYLDKHAEDNAELYADASRGTITAIINAATGRVPGDDTDQVRLPGWGDHRATLNLNHHPDWLALAGHNEKWCTQTEFAELIDDLMPLFTNPTGADMLELAQTFRASTSGTFESSRRLKSGETTLGYSETHTAAAGAKGDLTIPDTFTVGVQVYEHGQRYALTGRFRYRITSEKQLRLGYKLIRHIDVRDAAFDGVVAEVTAKGYPVLHGTY